MKKITLFSESLNGGGAEYVMKTLAECFSKRNFETEYIVIKKEGVYIEEVMQHTRIVDFNCRARYIIPKLYQYLRIRKPDILLTTQSHINIASILGTRLSRTNTKIVSREATTLSKDLNAKEKNNSITQKLLYKNVYKLSDAVICVSDGVKNDLLNNLGVPESKLKTIYNPIISKEFYNNANEEISHKWINDKTSTIVSVGRFAKAKDFPMLIDALRYVRKSKNCKLIILGETNYDPAVLNEVNKKINQYNLDDHVDMIGFVNNPLPYLKKASLFVLSSLYEGLPGSLIQACALNPNIVSTDCESGPREILANGKFGTLVPVHNPISLSEAILYKLNNPSKIINNTILNNFDRESIVHQYISLFKELNKA